MPRTIRVVMDNNYPPYVFEAPDHTLNGILVDQWRLWEKHTGCRVEIHAMDWGEALRRMGAGEFDVIDTIFRTPAREGLYDFTRPYAQLDVPIFFRRDITGITDLASLTGFPVAAKEGDAAVDLLRQRGVNTLQLFHSYEAIARAAQEHKVNVFVIDRPPALYYLYKFGLESEFVETAPVNRGEFHRAVRKGDAQLLRLVEKGFASLPAAQLRQIDEKWFGAAVNGRPYLVYTGYLAAAALLLAAGLAGWNRLLKRVVNQRTAALQASESHLRALLDHIPDAVWLKDAQSRYITVNAAYARALQRTPEQVAGLADADFWPPEKVREFVADDRAVLASGQPRLIRESARQADGRFVWFETIKAPVRSSSGAVIGTVGIARDITERQLADAARRESEDRFRQVVENIQEVFWMSDVAENQMIYISPGFEKVWGRTAAELYASPHAWSDSILPEDRERVVTAARTQQVTGDYDVEYRIVRPDGAVRWIRDRAFPIRDAAGQVCRIVGVAEDITEQRNLKEQFLRAQRLEAIGTLAGGVAHDLNNILSPILLATDLLRHELKAPHGQDMLQIVERSAQRAAAITAQLLTFSRGIPGVRDSVQLRHLLVEMTHLMQETFPRNIVITQDVPADLRPISGDTTQLHQVIMNLCVNARDAMPDGGRLTVTARNVQVEEAEAKLHPAAHAGPHVMLAIRDTGCGIPPENLRRIFDPFFTTKAVGKGTGLGLSTVLGIVKSHGGFVTAESEPGHGAVFKVYLPAAESTDAPRPAGADTPLPAGHGELILVVDDEPSIREATRLLLEKYNYRVRLAADGKEALRLIAEPGQEIRLVLTDVMMPGMSGLDLIRALRSTAPKLSILATSGLDHEDKLAEFTALGVTRLLIKPCPPSVLLTAITQALAESP